MTANLTTATTTDNGTLWTAVFAIPVSIKDGGEYQLDREIVHCLALIGRKHDFNCRNRRQTKDGLCGSHSKRNRQLGGSLASQRVG